MTRLHFASALLPSGWADDVQMVIDRRRDRRGDAGRGAGAPATSATESRFRAWRACTATPSSAAWRGWRSCAATGTDTLLDLARDDVSLRAGDDAGRRRGRRDASSMSRCSRQGFTRVGEFHYLHHDRDGAPYADLAEMATRIAAARRSHRHRADAAAECFMRTAPSAAPHRMPASAASSASVDQLRHADGCVAQGDLHDCRAPISASRRTACAR